jgi:spore coat polysaccharide biosynthesis protein SpsF
MKIGAIITARSTSSRYPRKHLGQLGDRTMIEQIINKLKKLNGLDIIILSTTNKNTDNELCNVAWAAGATINRGPEYNLLERDLQAIYVHDLDAILTISGDCPFISNEYTQILIDGVLREPNLNDYDIIGGFGNLSPMPGFVTTIQMKSAYYKYKMLMEKYPGYSYEQYWVVIKEEPDLLKTLTIDTSEINPPEITPMKMSIDWNLERLFWNKVIDWLGYYPQTIADFNKAFGGMESL